MTENFDNYVECGECGHAIEQHSTVECLAAGHGECKCKERWTLAEIRRVRVREGLPARWRS